jgi:seryl-tRNA synthetase
MFDIRWIRENPEAFDRGLVRRGEPAMATTVLDLDALRRAALTVLQEIQTRRNEASKPADRRGGPPQG